MKMYLVIYVSKQGLINYEHIKAETPEEAAKQFDGAVHVAEVGDCWDIEKVTEKRAIKVKFN